jgi:hypothetical protein
MLVISGTSSCEGSRAVANTCQGNASQQPVCLFVKHQLVQELSSYGLAELSPTEELWNGLLRMNFPT